jgi:hypothetical protein
MMELTSISVPLNCIGKREDAGPLRAGRHRVANQRFTQPLHVMKRRCGL